MSNTEKPERIAVVGLGLLGRGIAACFLGHGFEVVAVDRCERQHVTARSLIDRMIGELIDFGGFDARLRDEWGSRYSPTTDFAILRDCSFVVESVTEDLAIKEDVLDCIESVASETVVVASNTSVIPIHLLQQRRKHPGRLVGMHWAEPAHATRFMELIRGEQTTDQAFQATAIMARRLGKDPTLCQKDIPGFIVNRIAYAMYREALYLLDTGVADADTIDRTVRNAIGLFATICGPFRWIDLTGGPELYAKAMKPVLPTLSQAGDLSPMMRKLAANGARGIANGRGFFDYSPKEARHWEELYRQHAWRVSQWQNQYFPLKEKPPS